MARIFEFWLTFSFGAVVATRFASDKFNGSYIKLMSFGYLIVSVWLFIVRVNLASQIVELIDMMNASGYDTARFETMSGMATYVGGIIILIIGTASILLYMFRAHNKQSQADA